MPDFAERAGVPGWNKAFLSTRALLSPIDMVHEIRYYELPCSSH